MADVKFVKISHKKYTGKITHRQIKNFR